MQGKQINVGKSQDEIITEEEESKINPSVDKNNKKHTFPVGMRIIKTVIAVFVCMIIDFLRGEIPDQSIITTAICIQPDRKDSVSSALSRLLGTLVGAVYGMIVFFLFSKTLSETHILIYYLIVALFMIPLIYMVAKLHISSGVIVALVVYFSITLLQGSSDNSWTYIFNRVGDTFIGILVALSVDLLPLPDEEYKGGDIIPFKKRKKK